MTQLSAVPISDRVMDKSVSIVRVDNRRHRVIARENWGLTREQMKEMHVHHRIRRCDGGTNDPSNLYVCSEWYHTNVWHNPEDYLSWAAKGGKNNKGVKKKAKEGKRLGRPKGIKDSIQTRERKSKARMGSKNPRYGVTLSKETKDKISAKKKGKKQTEERRRKQKKAIEGRKWWINKDGDRKLQRESPGDGWINAREWKG